MNTFHIDAELLAYLFDAQPLPVFWATPLWNEEKNRITDFTYQYCNDYMLRYLRLPADQLVGSKLSENPHLNQELKERFHQQLEEVIKTGNTLEDTVYNPVLDKYYSFLRTPIQDGVITVIQDHTSEYHTIRELEQKNNLLDNILKFSASGISVTEVIRDATGRIIDGRTLIANEAASRYTGIPLDIYLSARVTELDPKILETPLYQMSLRTLETGEPFHTQYFMDTSQRWLELTVSRMDKDHLINLFTDITATKEAQLKLERAASRLSSVFNASQSGMFVFAPEINEEGELFDFRFVIANPSFAAYVGQSPQAIEGELGSTWFPGYLHNGVFDMYKHTFLTGETQRKEVHYLTDGLDLYLDLMSSRIEDTVLVTFTDHTALRKAQFELERSVEELKRTNANLEEFAYAASHDLKEPVRKVQFFADRLKLSLASKVTADEQHILNRMELAAQRMGSLIDDLLEYSSVNARPAQHSPVDLNFLISNVLNDLELLIAEKKAQITQHSLPTVPGQARQLQQLFQNLLVNALKYCKPGIPPVVNISYARLPGSQTGLHLAAEEAAGHFHLVSISDNGIGFEQKDAERIFQVFQRLHTEHTQRGTGLGLAIARKVAQNHGGYLTAESKPGEGSTFRVFLPA